MATEYLGAERAAANLRLHDLANIAGALKRLNTIETAPVLSVEDRRQVSEAKALCWTTVATAVETLVSLMDAIAGDADVELNGDENDHTNAEDEENERYGYGSGPGCAISDPDAAIDDGPCDEPHQDLEPDNDAELETWSHPDDHPAELFIGKRPGGKE